MSEENPPSISEEEARRQRQAALRALAQSQLGLPAEAPRGSPSSGAPARRRRRPAPWLLILSAVLFVAVIASAVLYQTGRLPGRAAASRAGPASVVLAPSLRGLDCIHDVVWSPDGRQIAVLGYRDLCPSDDPGNYNYQAGVLHIYSAATGRLLRTILPDAAVLALPGIPLPSPSVQGTTSISDTSKPVIDYTHVLWSPDGKSLALTFDINQWPANFGGQPFLAFTGLALMNADGTGERAALWKETNERPVLTYTAHSALRWDTSTMSALPLPDQPKSDYLASLPPAQSYSWSAAGQLVPGAALATATSPTAPTGNPDGGGSFTIWQAGYIAFIAAGPANTAPAPGAQGVYVLTTALPIASPDGYLSWSPDGRYLIDSVSMLAIQHPVGRPNPSASALQTLNMASAPIAPIHDAALQQTFISLSISAQTAGFLPTDYVAWSPNGHFLAAISVFGPPSSSGGTLIVPKVTVYNCATGQLLATIMPEANAQISLSQLTANAYLGATSLLRWSADGSHLLVFSSTLDTITIWGPGQLPPGS